MIRIRYDYTLEIRRERINKRVAYCRIGLEHESSRDETRYKARF